MLWACSSWSSSLFARLLDVTYFNALREGKVFTVALISFQLSLDNPRCGRHIYMCGGTYFINIYIYTYINDIILYKYSATIPLTSVMVMVTTYWQLVVFRMHGVCMGNEPYRRYTARSV